MRSLYFQWLIYNARIIAIAMFYVCIMSLRACHWVFLGVSNSGKYESRNMWQSAQGEVGLRIKRSRVWLQLFRMFRSVGKRLIP